MTGSDIPDRIGTGLARREPHGSQQSHHFGHVREFHKMQLDILPRGHVAHTGGKLVGQLGNPPHLISRQATERNFDAEHLDARLALTVNAVLQPERFENIRGEVPCEDTMRLGLNVSISSTI